MYKELKRERFRKVKRESGEEQVTNDRKETETDKEILSNSSAVGVNAL